MKMNWLEKLGVNSPLHNLELQRTADHLLRLGGEVAGGQVLEIGCGRGMGVDIIFSRFKAASVEAFEFDPDQLRLAKQRLTAKYGDKVRLYEASAAQIPAPEGKFEAVFDFGVLHHVPENQQALLEVARVLKPGGRFFFQEILAAMTFHPLVRLLAPHPPAAQFTWEDLAKKITAAGLKIQEGSFRVSKFRAVGVAQKP